MKKLLVYKRNFEKEVQEEMEGYIVHHQKIYRLQMNIHVSFLLPFKTIYDFSSQQKDKFTF